MSPEFDVHCLVDLVHCEVAMDLLQCQPRILHSLHGFLVDIRSLDTAYFPLHRHNLR